jgi:hypothetical protein
VALSKVLDREVLNPTTSTGFTTAKIAPTDGTVVRYVIVQPAKADIRFHIDGSTPTTSQGNRLTEDTPIEIHGVQAMSNFRCIDDGGAADVECVMMGDA